MRPRILIVDDEAHFREVLAMLLSDLGVELTTAANGREALRMATEQVPSLVLSDLSMPEMDGKELLTQLKLLYPDLPVILITAHGSIESAVEAMRLGAFDYLTKPFEEQTLKLTLQRALKYVGILAQNQTLRAELERRFDFKKIIGESPAMVQALKLSGQVAQTEATALILGESGTGKELLARAIHYNSRRATGPFVAMNCAAIPENLLESELFGHERGAFTGADRRRPGRVEGAAGGTLFLDEIGDMPANLQAKILRLLQEREFQRVGGQDTIQVDVRFVCATNRNLEEMVKQGTFREDLFYRVNVFPITLPPLRERTGDILVLARVFLERFCREMGKPTLKIPRDTAARLAAYRWPGNIRELENVMERGVILAEGPELTIDELPREISDSMPQGVDHSDPDRSFILPTDGIHLEALERDLLVQALERTRYNQTRAAKLLGLSRATLRYRLEKYKLT